MRTPTLIIATLLVASPAVAGEVIDASPGHFTWEENAVTGPVFEATPQGWQIYTHMTQAVKIADRRGIESAKIIAEERAKGAIVAFMHQHSTNFRAHVEEETTTNKTTAADGGTPVADATTRDVTDALAQAQTSFASGDLYGVTVIGQDYDEAKREVTVKVGMSSKSVAQAREMRRAMAEAGSDDRAPAPSQNAPKPNTRRSAPGSETNHLKNDDW